MILRTVHIFSVIVLTAETLPFPDMNFRPASVNQADKNFHRLHSTFYPLFGHPSQPIRQPGIQFSDKLNKGEERFADFVSLRSRNPSSVFVDQNLGNIHQKKAQKARRLGQQIRNTVQHYEERHRQRMQHVKGMLSDKSRFDKVKNRLKQALANKKASLKKLQRCGRCRIYIGEPYHTMNDDHKIVKKPSANFDSYSQTNVGTPILASVPAIQPIATQYPAVPEVTTSVNFHQESEVTATIAGYVFPVTSIAAYTPDVIETTDIGNSIGQEKMRTPQLPLDASNCTETTTIFTHPGTESEILEANSEQETIFTAVDVSSRIKNEDFDTVTIDQGTTTEIDSSLSPLLSTQTTWQIETIEPPASQATLLLDLMLGIQVKPFTSLVIDVESTTTEIGPTFSATTSSIDDNFISNVIDTDTTITEIVSTFSSTLPTRKTLGTEGTSRQPQARRTTTVVDEVFGTTNTDFTSPATDPDSTDETIFTIPFIHSIDTATVTNAISTTVETTYDSSTIDEKITMELVSTLPSTISTETTAWLPPASEIDPILNVLFGFGYNRFPSFTDEVEIETTTADATFPSTTQTETIKILEEISTTDSALYTHAVNDGETTTEIVSTLPSTISPEITSWPRITSLADVSSGFGYNHFPSFTDEVEITVGVDPTFSSLISTQTTMMMTERSTAVYPVTDNPTIETESTEIYLNFSSTISPETTTNFEETSTATDSHFNRSTTDEGITNDVLLTVSSTVQTDSTVVPVSKIASLLDALPSLGYNHFTDLTNAPETTTRVHSALVSTIPTEATTMLIERLMAVDLASDKPTLDVEITTEIVSAFPFTIFDEISTTMDPDPYFITTDGHTTSEIVSTLPSTISLETTSWPPTAVEITPLVEVLSRFGYNHFPSFTDTVGKTTEVYSTFTPTTTAETTTTDDEKLTTVELALNNSIIDTERTLEIVPMFFSSFSGERTTSLGNISATKPFDYSSIDEETTMQIISTFPTKTPMVEQDYLTDSPIAPTISTRDDSTSSFTIPTETIIRTTEIGSMFPSIFSTSKITNLEGISTIKPFDYSSNDKGTTMEIISTIATEQPIVVHNHFTDSTIAPEINTKIESTLSTTVSTETIRTTEMDSMFPTTFSTDPTTNLEEISRTIPFYYLSNNEGTTMEIISTFPTDASILEHDYLTDSSIAPELSTRDEIDSIFPSIFSTKLITNLEEISTIKPFDYSSNDKGTTMEIISTIATEEPIVVYDHFTDSTITPEITAKIESTLSTTISIETIRTTEMDSMFPTTLSTNPTTNLEEISRTIPFNYLSNDEETTMEIISTFPTDAPIVEHDYLTDSSIAPEITIREDSKPSYIIPTETLTIVTEGWTTPTIENSIATDTSHTMETDSIVESISTEILEEVSTTKSSPDDSTTIYEETSTTVIPTSSYVVLTETMMNAREISKGAHPASKSYTDAGETTTKKIAMLSTPISIDTTALSIDEYDDIAEQNFEYLEGNQVNSGVRVGRLLHENSDLMIPHVTYTAEEAPDEKSLLNLIPLIIDELRQDNVTPQEEHTLSQVFRDLWPLLKEEAKRRPGELMDHKLAILIFEAGQRLSDNDRLARDVATDNLR